MNFLRKLTLFSALIFVATSLNAGPGIAIFELGKGKKSKAYKLNKFKKNKKYSKYKSSYKPTKSWTPKKVAPAKSLCSFANPKAKSYKSELMTTVYFPLGSTTLTSASLKQIKAVQKKIAKSGDKILLSGHADKSGSYKRNQTLSCKRAMKVKTLMNQIPSDKLLIEGRSYSKPKYSVKSKNRRVEIYRLVKI